MRRIVGVLLVALAACGDSTSPGKTKVTFRVDGQTCIGTATLDFFIDGALVGTAAVAAGATSPEFETTRGPHSLGAQVSNTRSRVWGPINVDLSGFATWVQVLPCA